MIFRANNSMRKANSENCFCPPDLPIVLATSLSGEICPSQPAASSTCRASPPICGPSLSSPLPLVSSPLPLHHRQPRRKLESVSSVPGSAGGGVVHRNHNDPVIAGEINWSVSQLRTLFNQVTSIISKRQIGFVLPIPSHFLFFIPHSS